MPPASLLSSSLLPSNPLPFLSSNLPTRISPSNKITSKSSTQENPSTQRSEPITGIPATKLPTPPWLTPPLPLPPEPKPIEPNSQKTRQKPNAYKSLTQGVRGGRGRQAMKKIVRSIKSLRKAEPEQGLAQQVLEFSEEESVSVPWVRVEERMVFRREKRERVATRAETELPREELERLRVEARRLGKWVRAKKAGVTQEVVGEILRAWRKEELVMVRLVEPLCRNLDRAREIVEIKTGGLVVLSKKDALVVYRHQSNAKLFQKDIEFGPPKTTSMNWLLDNDVGSTNESLYVREANRLLDSLGPRFVDWWYKKPLPVDADLLPEVVPGFKPPFRLCPPEERPKLRDDELTYLRKIARPLPTHFALGKNTKLQGLAAAIIKLWEKCLIAKIAIKVGIPHTNNQQMGQELKSS